MTEEYYTPSIEDIKIGYECEISLFNIGEFDTSLQKDWFKFIVSNDEDITYIIKLISMNLVRNPLK